MKRSKPASQKDQEMIKRAKHPEHYSPRPRETRNMEAGSSHTNQRSYYKSIDPDSVTPSPPKLRPLMTRHSDGVPDFENPWSEWQVAHKQERQQIPYAARQTLHSAFERKEPLAPLLRDSFKMEAEEFQKVYVRGFKRGGKEEAEGMCTELANKLCGRTSEDVEYYYKSLRRTNTGYEHTKDIDPNLMSIYRRAFFDGYLHTLAKSALVNFALREAKANHENIKESKSVKVEFSVELAEAKYVLEVAEKRYTCAKDRRMSALRQFMELFEEHDFQEALRHWFLTQWICRRERLDQLGFGILVGDGKVDIEQGFF